MAKLGFFVLLVLGLVSLVACRQPQRESSAQPARRAAAGPEMERVKAAMEAVRPLHQPMGPPQFLDWRSVFPEHGQTFQEWLASKPTLPEGRRRVIYVTPLGDLTPAQLQVVELTADYLGRFFNLPTRLQPALPLAKVPAEHHRFNATLGTEQIKTGYLLGSVLKPRLPDDAVASIGLTAVDLYPEPKMNFVFGQASLRDRVGVWSIHHLGEPDQGPRELRACLIRALKIASHETGHMFSIRHCTKYECVMNGSNSLREVDRHPIDACPECMAKICWATGCDPRVRYERLASFFARHGMDAERQPFERAARILSDRTSRPSG